jgi:hypothetical protein
MRRIANEKGEFLRFWMGIEGSLGKMGMGYVWLGFEGREGNEGRE